jgi:hypothetical protein
VEPASTEDEQLLTSILSFLAPTIPFFVHETGSLSEMLSSSLTYVLIPTLEKTTRNRSKPSGVDLVLPSTIIVFLQSVLKYHLSAVMSHPVLAANCIKAITNFTHWLFSLDVSLTDVYHSDRLRCLDCMLIFVSMPNFVSVVSGEIGARIIRLFVAILSFSQQSYSNSTDGNAFTYKDRSVYRLVAICLRNVSRCVVVPSPSYRSSLWGDHWLYEDDIKWLLLLLNDDERMIQKYGLGILGNLVLIKESYHHLIAKIPQFLDMAFSYALDFERAVRIFRLLQFFF